MPIKRCFHYLVQLPHARTQTSQTGTVTLPTASFSISNESNLTTQSALMSWVLFCKRSCTIKETWTKYNPNIWSLLVLLFPDSSRAYIWDRFIEFRWCITSFRNVHLQSSTLTVFSTFDIRLLWSLMNFFFASKCSFPILLPLPFSWERSRMMPIKPQTRFVFS